MTIRPRTLRTALLSALCTISLAVPGISETLGDAMREAKTDRLLGTWIDQETKGENVKLTYRWKFENMVIETTAKFGDTESVGLVSRHPGTQDIHQVGVNNKGGGGLGKWSMVDGDPVLDLNYVSEDGEEGTMRIRYHFVDDDTLELTFGDAAEPQLTLVRQK